MSEFVPPTIAPAPEDGSAPQPVPEAPEPAPITEQDIGEYREQDRFLPVRAPLPPPRPRPDLSIYRPRPHIHVHLTAHTLCRCTVTPWSIRKIANVSRIMKSSVPSTAKISKEAKECVQECVSEFISFITSEAAEKCQMEKRKTIGGEDILYAMVTLGFDDYVETLKIHLAKLRQVCAS